MKKTHRKKHVSYFLETASSELLAEATKTARVEFETENCAWLFFFLANGTAIELKKSADRKLKKEFLH